MFAKIVSKLQALFGGSSGIDHSESAHPLDRPKQDHQVKQREVKQELDKLRSERDELKEKLDEKKSKYKQEKQAGNEERATDILSDAENIESKLETVRGRINETQQQQTFISNILRSYEIRETHEDTYWQQLKDMDEESLFRQFGEEEMETEEMLGMLDKGTSASGTVIDSYSEQTDRMSSQSDLESEWTEEVGEDETSVSTEDVVKTDEANLDGVDTKTNDDDVRLN